MNDLRELLAGLPSNPPLCPAWLTGAEPVALYGAGGIGREVLRALTGRGVNVRAALDAKATPGSRLEGMPVRRPDDPGFAPATRGATTVLITIFNPDVEIAPIAAELRRLGWGAAVAFTDFHRFLAAELGDRYWLTTPDFYRDRATVLRAAGELWADEPSRALFAAIVRYRLAGGGMDLPAPELDSQYFPTGVPAWRTPVRFVDCGAFDGDTLGELFARKLPVAAVAAFEPEAANLRKLAARVATLAPPGTEGAPEALLWPCAVFSHTTSLRFASGQGAGSGVSETGGDVVVQAVSLDEALPGFRPTFIKMDIEGAEPQALLGARGLIERDRPGLAVCVYHRPEHLWQIPLLLRDWDLSYRFYLRSHRFNGFDLVLYAVPSGDVPSL